VKLVDVRSFPGSRRFPQFNREDLESLLEENGLSYYHLKELGGLRRKGDVASVNTAWKNESFRNYADYMQTAEFREGIDSLLRIAGDSRTVIMCAEAVPWRCHRQLISDYLVALRGIEVFHIIDASQLRQHTLTAFAQVEGETLIYPEEGPSGSRDKP